MKIKFFSLNSQFFYSTFINHFLKCIQITYKGKLHNQKLIVNYYIVTSLTNSGFFVSTKSILFLTFKFVFVHFTTVTFTLTKKRRFLSSKQDVLVRPLVSAKTVPRLTSSGTSSPINVSFIGHKVRAWR